MCKTELEEVVISKDYSLTWAHFKKKLKKKAIEDDEDETILYTDEESHKAGQHLRTLNCMVYNCKAHRSDFPNVISLTRHLEH